MKAPRDPRPHQTLSKQDRVRSSEEYRRIQRSGVRRGGARFTVLVAPSSGIRSRLGITIPRQVGNAVLRNRLRRLVREYFRTRREQFGDAHDFVVIPRPGTRWLRLRDLNEIGRLAHEARSRVPRRSG
ncbi:MAG: ribonuclease P protein component [Deltaproteobacteria bacterium]|nr:ribonuclease P protein component [Deltaproteobacteria bacterium]